MCQFPERRIAEEFTGNPQWFYQEGTNASGVPSRPVRPVPPVVKIISTLGSAIHWETIARSCRYRRESNYERLAGAPLAVVVR